MKNSHYTKHYRQTSYKLCDYSPPPVLLLSALSFQPNGDTHPSFFRFIFIILRKKSVKVIFGTFLIFRAIHRAVMPALCEKKAGLWSRWYTSPSGSRCNLFRTRLSKWRHLAAWRLKNNTTTPVRNSIISIGLYGSANINSYTRISFIYMSIFNFLYAEILICRKAKEKKTI